MKKYYLFASLVLLVASPGFAQTKIGAPGAPDGSAMLEVTSGTANNKGLLLPRMTLTQRDAIPAPATGLMIYNTTANQVQVNTGTPIAPYGLLPLQPTPAGILPAIPVPTLVLILSVPVTTRRWLSAPTIQKKYG